MAARGSVITINCNPNVLALLDELTKIARRRGSLPEFRDRLAEIVEILPGALETCRVDGEGDTASAFELSFSSQFSERFLSRVAALRAFDRDFDGSREFHGASV